MLRLHLDKSFLGRVGEFDAAQRRKLLWQTDERESPCTSALIRAGGNILWWGMGGSGRFCGLDLMKPIISSLSSILVFMVFLSNSRVL